MLLSLQKQIHLFIPTCSPIVHIALFLHHHFQYLPFILADPLWSLGLSFSQSFPYGKGIRLFLYERLSLKHRSCQRCAIEFAHKFIARLSDIPAVFLPQVARNIVLPEFHLFLYLGIHQVIARKRIDGRSLSLWQYVRFVSLGSFLLIWRLIQILLFKLIYAVSPDLDQVLVCCS